MVVNISEACAHLGYRSRSTVQRLIKAGHLNAYLRPGGGRAVLLETDPPGLPSLRSAVQALTQVRYDSPLWRRERNRAEPVALEQLCDEALEAAMEPINRWADNLQTPDWARIAQLLNGYLGDSWPAPPYTGEQAATLAMCLALATDGE
jgi:hypothetical protein